ncbi:MAG: Release factor glutamine methyltransferase [Candidatus Anoxychlamydiales bacterium]|nr:Release factor glutamine methyltransferase [Candidatus Anoxychlamydiales bacterium]
MKIFDQNSILSLIKSAILFLEKQNIQNAKNSAEVLLSDILKIKKNDLYLYYENKVSKKDIEKFQKLIFKRSKKEPLEYILKKIDFYGCSLEVNKHVLIPRVETEILVDLIAQKLETENLDNRVLFDICTGSGCIGIALKKRFPKLKVFVSDISKKALNVAKINAKKNLVNIFFKLGDLLTPFKNLKADFIVSNPPYVSEEEFMHLDEDIKTFEPKKALIAKDSGLEFYKKIEKKIFQYANKNAKLFFEIGYTQKKDIINIFSSEKYVSKQVIKDFSKKDRFFFVEIE